MKSSVASLANSVMNRWKCAEAHPTLVLLPQGHLLQQMLIKNSTQKLKQHSTYYWGNSSIHCVKMCKHSKSFCKQPNFNIPKHDKPTCHPTIKVLFALGKPLCQKKIWGSKSLSRVWFALYQSNPMSILPKYLLFHFLFKTYFLKHLFSVNWLEAKVASTVESI